MSGAHHASCVDPTGRLDGDPAAVDGLHGKQASTTSSVGSDERASSSTAGSTFTTAGSALTFTTAGSASTITRSKTVTEARRPAGPPAPQ